MTGPDKEASLRVTGECILVCIGILAVIVAIAFVATRFFPR